MTPRWWSRLIERRRAKHSPPFSEAELELLFEVSLEARALRRRRARGRRLLVKGMPS